MIVSVVGRWRLVLVLVSACGLRDVRLYLAPVPWQADTQTLSTLSFLAFPLCFLAS